MLKKSNIAVCRKPPNPTFYIIFKHYTKHIVGDGSSWRPEEDFLNIPIFFAHKEKNHAIPLDKKRKKWDNIKIRRRIWR